MHPSELNEKNVSIVIQSAMERLQAIDSRIQLKETELKKATEDEAKAKAELEQTKKDLEQVLLKKTTATNELEQVRKEIESVREQIKSEEEKGIAKLEALYQKLTEAKEQLLATITQNINTKEKEAFAIIDTVQVKKGVIQQLEKEIAVAENELENAKKQAFNLQTKFDDLREKEQFIMKKYEDAGIPYNK